MMRIIGLDLVDPFDGIATAERQQWITATIPPITRSCRAGDPEPFHIEETDSSFSIEWKGHYRIEGAAFVYTDRDTGRITTVLGYPTNKLTPEE